MVLFICDVFSSPCQLWELADRNTTLDARIHLTRGVGMGFAEGRLKCNRPLLVRRDSVGGYLVDMEFTGQGMSSYIGVSLEKGLYCG